MLEHSRHSDDSALGLVVSLRPRFADAIVQGQKNVEVRRTFSERWLGARAVLYATSPTRAVVGSALVTSIERLSVADLWFRYGPRIGITRDELLAYADERASLFAIGLDRVRRLSMPLPLSAVRAHDPIARPPRSYAAIEPGSAWASALGWPRSLWAG